MIRGRLQERTALVLVLVDQLEERLRRLLIPAEDLMDLFGQLRAALQILLSVSAALHRRPTLQLLGNLLPLAPVPVVEPQKADVFALGPEVRRRGWFV